MKLHHTLPLWLGGELDNLNQVQLEANVVMLGENWIVIIAECKSLKSCNNLTPQLINYAIVAYQNHNHGGNPMLIKFHGITMKGTSPVFYWILIMFTLGGKSTFSGDKIVT